MRAVRLIAILALLATSCTSEIDRGPQRPEASEPATGPLVATMQIGETSFELHDEGGGCAAARVIHPGLQETVHRRCFRGEQVLAETDACGWLAEPAVRSLDLVADRPGPDCDVVLPVAFYGYVDRRSIGFVCVGAIMDTPDSATGVTGARFVDVEPEGWILTAAGPGESIAAHLFTPGGLRFGDPPLDAPSDPIYRLCEADAPWGETTEIEYWVEIWISADEELHTDKWAFGVAGGTGGEAVSGGALAEAATVQMALRVPASAVALSIWIETIVEGDRLLEATVPWPEQVLELLAGDRGCRRPRVTVHFGAAALDGAAQAIAIGWDGSDCPDP